MQLREDAGLTWGRISGEGATEEGKEASNIQKEKGARFSDNLNERRRQVMEGRKGGREEGKTGEKKKGKERGKSHKLREEISKIKHKSQVE